MKLTARAIQKYQDKDPIRRICKEGIHIHVFKVDDCYVYYKIKDKDFVSVMHRAFIKKKKKKRYFMVEDLTFSLEWYYKKGRK